MGKEEAFARKCAAEGWSQSNVADALGLSKYKLRLWLETVPPIKWPKPWESKNAKAAVKRLNESREGIYPEQFRRTAEKARETRRINLLTKTPSKTNTVSEHAKEHGVSAEAVRRRVAQGFRLEYALVLAKRAKKGRRYTAFGMTAPLSVLVSKFGVVTREAVTKRMSRGMEPEAALTLPPQHLVAAYGRKDNHPWKHADEASFKRFYEKNPTAPNCNQRNG